MNNLSFKPSCSVCGNTQDDAALLVEYGESGCPETVCALCYMRHSEKDLDVQFFLATIDKQIPEAERLVRTDFHHTIPEWVASVKSLTRIKDMRSFADGCTRWHVGPAIRQEEAALITLDNIGCVMNEVGWWKRLKWWWATGVTRSQQFHC